ncbi:MAG: hypothetical protein AB8B96_10715 [Lysobacterales bacterium]
MAKSGKYRRRRSLRGHLVVWLRNLIIAAVVAVVAGKFYANHKLEEYLEQAAGIVSSAGTLTVADSSAGFDGKLTVNNLSFIPDPGLDAPPVTVREAVVHTPGLLWLVGFGRSEMPNSMGLTLNGMKMELGDILGQGQRSSISGITTETLACADITRFETIDLNNMGFADMESNVDARYRLMPPDVIEIQVVMENSNASEVLMEIQLSAEQLIDIRRGNAPPPSNLKSMSLTFQASEFNRRRNSYCAAQAEISTEEFLENHLAAVRQLTTDDGYEMSDELSYQYRRFAEGEGVWTFLSRPDKPLAMERLANQPPWRILELLKVNSAIASGVPQPVTIYPIMPVEDRLADTVDDEGNAVQRPVQQSRSWKKVSLGNLGSHIGSNVRLNSRSGKQYTGRLISVSGDSVVLDTLMTGGSAQIPIPLDQIFRARVLTRD